MHARSYQLYATGSFSMSALAMRSHLRRDTVRYFSTEEIQVDVGGERASLNLLYGGEGWGVSEAIYSMPRECS